MNPFANAGNELASSRATMLRFAWKETIKSARRENLVECLTQWCSSEPIGCHWIRAAVQKQFHQIDIALNEKEQPNQETRLRTVLRDPT